MLTLGKLQELQICMTFFQAQHLVFPSFIYVQGVKC